MTRGRSRNRVTHDLHIDLFGLQVAYEFMLSLIWVPHGRQRLRGRYFAVVSGHHHQACAGRFPARVRGVQPLSISASWPALRLHSGPRSLKSPFLSSRDMIAKALYVGRDVLAQNVAALPSSGVPAFGSCFPLPVMAGHVVQHLAECRAHAVALAPAAKSLWFPSVWFVTVRSMEVAPRCATGCFQRPSTTGSFREWRYPRDFDRI